MFSTIRVMNMDRNRGSVSGGKFVSSQCIILSSFYRMNM